MAAELRLQRVREVEAPHARRARRHVAENTQADRCANRRVHAERNVARPQATGIGERADTEIAQVVRPSQEGAILEPADESLAARRIRGRVAGQTALPVAEAQIEWDALAPPTAE